MKKTLGKIAQPSVFGSKGGATTLLYVILIVALWLSITGRVSGVRAALAGTSATTTATPPEAGTPGAPGYMPPALPHRNPDGSWTLPNGLPGLPPLNGGIGH